MSTIKIKRSTGSAAPASLADGELAYAQGSDKLFIGKAGVVKEILDFQSNTALAAAVAANTVKADANALAITATEAATATNTSGLSSLQTQVNILDTDVVHTAVTNTVGFGFVVDEDDMVSDSQTKLPTQQSVKAYVDTELAAAVVGGMSFKGDFNSTAIGSGLVGDTYIVSTATSFLGVNLEVGDMVVAKVDNPATTVGNYTFINRNIDDSAFIAATEKAAASGVASLDANSEVVQLPAGAAAAPAANFLKADGSWGLPTAVPSATETVSGSIELATQAEVDAGTDAVTAVTPATLASTVIDGGTWTTAIN